MIAAALLTMILGSAGAEDRECWYFAQNGEHDFEQTDAGYATCTENGYYVIECRQCGYYRKETTEKATGHKWVETHREEPGECSYGMIIEECSRCSQSRSKKTYPDGTLYRGIKDSDGVKELQMMLIDCGYLNDSMDGKFGKIPRPL